MQGKKKKERSPCITFATWVVLSFFVYVFVATDATYWIQAISEETRQAERGRRFKDALANKRSPYHPVVRAGFWYESGVPSNLTDLPSMGGLANEEGVVLETELCFVLGQFVSPVLQPQRS